MKGRCQLLISEHRPKVLQVNTGIVATPLFWVNIPAACERVGFGAKFPGVETDDHVELGKVFRAMCLPRGEDLGCREVLQVLMVGDNIDRCASSFEVVLPMFEGIVDSREFFIMNIVVGFVSGSLPISSLTPCLQLFNFDSSTYCQPFHYPSPRDPCRHLFHIRKSLYLDTFALHF